MRNWLTFDGQMQPGETGNVRCTANHGGEFEISSQDVMEEEGKLYVLQDATVSIVQNPAPSDSEDGLTPKGTACIGMIQIDCQTGQVLGPCIGVWGCSETEE